MNNPFSLENKLIVVTGASSGIGQQVAISCSKMGARVILIGRNIERLNETVNKMDNVDIHKDISIDLTNYSSVSQEIDDIVTKFGRIDGLVNCAGVSTTLPLKLCSTEKTEELFNVNVLSAYNLTKEVCKIGHFSKSGGSVIFLASIMGLVGENGKSLYSMSKGALISLSRSLACELARKQIRVNCISPGVIITPINQNLPHIADPEKRKILEEKHLLGLGETTDIANACIYLLSDASKWVTGTNLVVDGGYIAQ